MTGFCYDLYFLLWCITQETKCPKRLQPLGILLSSLGRVVCIDISDWHELGHLRVLILCISLHEQTCQVSVHKCSLSYFLPCFGTFLLTGRACNQNGSQEFFGFYCFGFKTSLWLLEIRPVERTKYKHGSSFTKDEWMSAIIPVSGRGSYELKLA